jgi:hypothetical protein
VVIKELTAAVLMVVIMSSQAQADTIHLKSGKSIQFQKTWEEDGQVKGLRDGVAIGFPKETVERVEKDEIARPDSQGGFTFDMWNSGIHLSEVLDVAARHDIPLRPQGILTVDKHFNRKLLEDHLTTRHFFEYRSELFGKWATVYLSFTPQSRLLSTVKVHFYGSSISRQSTFRQDLQKVLINQHGRPLRTAPSGPLIESVYWRKGERTSVELRAGSGFVEVIYKDFEVVRTGQMEQFDIDQKRQDTFRASDAAKF